MRRWDLPESIVSRMEGPGPPDDFACDGLTCAPDFVGPVDLRPAGLWHDWSYTLGGDEAARREADRRFYRNLLACGLGRRLARVYFRRVYLIGVRHFHYTAGPRPCGLWAFLCRLFGRYLSW